MKNVQISFDEDLLEAVDSFALSSKTSRSAIIRDALKQWLRQKEIQAFEDQWIRSIKESPDDSQTAEEWVQTQQWSDE